ncbi:glycyl-tRNA synthetase subunit beta [Actinoplanes sp. SE50]|uniref:glycine--tRNA ligase n=1 Tax=unclassified Actinoplanes TaxID=2626549 RepID=UPI00023EBBF7|nr:MULTISPECIES: glycine--tRNA ligase [unclassified Actinoplanes]AEV86238.1 glycyl-tRNA synthetase alpha chain [Actinoplanes sp. SE50/110]ATO84636.1 glycyl-tRNA synthetase subunit beta [Actinoplanes sp. SE50]SLM02046.1 glycine--tRNA ligase subunit alpha/beta [Actinoplanes sp. SE50/110]
MLTMQEALARLTAYWTEQGCLIVQPMNTEVGAGTLNPATFLRVLGPEPWRVVYVEPSVRPDDSRYGENPNRLQTHTQLQVILKPDPGNPQELYLGSLAALGIDVAAHDVRFVEDNWASPALGAWGLGWEVWLDGLEITQFTYFQQAGGLNLDPVSVEITYGIERIIMALQDKQHFKEIEYAPGVSYGEVFGQAEYEMSRYYLDDADIDANRRLLELYAGEAQRMIDAGLPVPAHSYVLKCSQAFNVLDSRGAVSTAERAAEFGRMRRLAGEVAKLWVARRAEQEHPLGTTGEPAAARAAGSTQTGDTPRTLLFEIGTEELPPAELRNAREQLLRLVTEGLAGTRLGHGEIRVFGTPRRLIAVVQAVAAREDDHVRTVKGPKTQAAYAADGTTPTKALDGFLRGQGATLAELETAEFNGVPHVVVRKPEAGGAAPQVLAAVLAKVVGGLRAAKNMRWNDPKLAFSRPLRWLTALWGDDVVPVAVSTLAAGRQTRLLRTAVPPVAEIASAETFLETLGVNGIVADHEDRRELIVVGAQDLVYPDGKVDVAGEAALIDQITDLVEQPLPLLGTFDEGYLTLPDAVLTTVMRKHQRYLPVRDEDGRLLPMFVTVANGPVDVELVRSGNEAVLRARYEDARFFYRADLDTPLAELKARLDRLTFTDKLGSMADRAGRIGALAKQLAERLDLGSPTLDRAAELVKFDLGSQLVTEMTSLAGVMARDYALHAGESRPVAEAVFEAELPRNTGDALPRTLPGALLSLADRLDLVAGLAATVGLPTGSSDPFAVRRAVLGLLAVHRATPEFADLSLVDALTLAAAAQPVPVAAEVLPAVADFLAKRLEQALTEEGRPVDRIRAVLPHFARPSVADTLLAQLAPAVADPDFAAVAAAIQRARRIVPDGTTARYDAGALKEPAELALHDAVTAVRAALGPDAGTDLPRFVAATGRLVTPVNTFFDDVLVMADDPAIRAARLGLLATVRDLGDGLLDWPQLRL